MIIDIFTLVILVHAALKGWKKGLILSVFSFVAVFTGLIAATRFSATVAVHLSGFDQIPSRWLPFVSFLLVFLCTLYLVHWIAQKIHTIAEDVMLGTVNKVGGMFFQVFLQLFIYSMFIFFLRRLGIITERMISESQTYSLIEPMAPWAFDGIGRMFPFLGSFLQDLRDFFDKTGDSLPAPQI